MSFLVSRILGDEVEIFASDDEGSVHFRGHDGTGKDTAADGDLAGEGAFLVYNTPVRIRYRAKNLPQCALYRCMSLRWHFSAS